MMFICYRCLSWQRYGSPFGGALLCMDCIERILKEKHRNGGQESEQRD